jgi:chromosome segregation ATPase
MIIEVESELVVQKTSTMKETMIQVRELLVVAQKEAVAEAKEVSVSEMMEHISSVKTSVEKKLERAVTKLKDGMKESSKEQKERQDRMEERMTKIKETVVTMKETSSETNVIVKEMQGGMRELKESVDISKKQNAQHEKDANELTRRLEQSLKRITKVENNMVDISALEDLQGLVMDANSKVSTISSRLDKEIEERESAVKSVTKRITANEEHLIEIEDSLSATDKDLHEVAEIMKEMRVDQSKIKDESVKAALKSVSSLVKETTEKVVETQLVKVREETSELSKQFKSSVTKLKKEMTSEQSTRQESDK